MDQGKNINFGFVKFANEVDAFKALRYTGRIYYKGKDCG
jgi:RNA recognition motif-containing protein